METSNQSAKVDMWRVDQKQEVGRRPGIVTTLWGLEATAQQAGSGGKLKENKRRGRSKRKKEKGRHNSGDQEVSGSSIRTLLARSRDRKNLLISSPTIHWSLSQQSTRFVSRHTPHHLISTLLLFTPAAATAPDASPSHTPPDSTSHTDTHTWLGYISVSCRSGTRSTPRLRTRVPQWDRGGLRRWRLRWGPECLFCGLVCSWCGAVAMLCY